VIEAFSKSGGTAPSLDEPKKYLPGSSNLSPTTSPSASTIASALASLPEVPAGKIETFGESSWVVLNLKT
jgi:hypothetical protein